MHIKNIRMISGRYIIWWAHSSVDLSDHSLESHNSHNNNLMTGLMEPYLTDIPLMVITLLATGSGS